METDRQNAALEEISALYRALDRALEIDTGSVRLTLSTRMVRQYGVCCFRAEKPVEIRLAAFLLDEPEQLRQTALHEYAHAAAALLSGKRHGHDALWKALCVRVGCRPERLSQPCPAAKRRAQEYQSARAGAPRYLVTCTGCGAVSRYTRRGKVVQALEMRPGMTGCICKRCGTRHFTLEVQRGNEA